MEEVYNWINKKASSVVKPNKIEELESCLEVADDLFQNMIARQNLSCKNQKKQAVT
jgi:hypothetical protein